MRNKKMQRAIAAFLVFMMLAGVLVTIFAGVSASNDGLGADPSAAPGVLIA